MAFHSSAVCGVRIECSYVESELYGCGVQNVKIFNGQRIKIDSAVGTHDDYKSNDDVEEIWIRSSPNLSLFPTNLEKVFKNLISISIYDSKLQQITQSDLKPFVNLKILQLHYNELKLLPENLFRFNPKLEEIYLNSNQISHIDPNVFDGLANLKKLNLDGNKCKVSFDTAYKRAAVVDIINRIRAGGCGQSVAEKNAKKENQQNFIPQMTRITQRILTTIRPVTRKFVSNNNKLYNKPEVLKNLDCGRVKVQKATQLIFNGISAYAGQWPWLASLFVGENKLICGSSIISQWHLLSGKLNN